MNQAEASKGESVTLIFTDGASEGNPGPGGWAFVVIGPLEERAGPFGAIAQTRVYEAGGHVSRTTNNRMELFAAIEAVSYARKLAPTGGNVRIYSDSSYVVNGISRWLPAWEKRGWKTASKGEVLNRDLWERLSESSRDLSITWNLLAGHRGIAGNERADALATAFASDSHPECYSGTFSNYKIPVLEIPLATATGGVPSRSKTPYSYISFVDGKIERHKNWAECSDRVRGKSNARFRKTFSPEEEARIISDWQRS